MNSTGIIHVLQHSFLSHFNIIFIIIHHYIIHVLVYIQLIELCQLQMLHLLTTHNTMIWTSCNMDHRSSSLVSQLSTTHFLYWSTHVQTIYVYLWNKIICLTTMDYLTDEVNTMTDHIVYTYMCILYGQSEENDFRSFNCIIMAKTLTNYQRSGHCPFTRSMYN